MYCCACKSIFDEPKKYYERGEAWGAPCTEKFEYCPYCNSDDIIDSDNCPDCDCCGEKCISAYIETKNGNYYCENCYEVYD